MPERERELILKYCLQNAVFYKGKASPGAVMGKVLAENPGLRKRAGELGKEIARTVKEVNKLSPEEQKKKLGKMAPELLERKEKEQGLPELEGAVTGKVVTRFAPAPTGPLNIAHLLRAALLSYIYAKRYRGRFILRLEDTDLKKVRKEYYRWIEEDLENAEVKPDLVVRESDHIERCYKLAEELMGKGKMYVCSCSAEGFRELKKKKKECPCRKQDRKTGMAEWKRMLNGELKEGQAVVRLKTGMAEPNPVLRDPPMLRIAEGEHPLTGKKYRVWPLYNFMCTTEDHDLGVTHVFRAKEHEHNTAVQKLVYQAFGWKQPITINFGMIYLPGAKLHTRDIKEMIEKGEVTGWDDPRLHTVRALLRRGFQPQAFKELAEVTGLSKSDIILGWENLEGINRKIIDPMANRFMVVKEPVKVGLKGVEKKEVEVLVHPDFPERGKRKLPVSGSVWLQKADLEGIKGEFRLIGLGNFKLKGKSAEFTGDKIVKGMPKIQWVGEPALDVEVLTPQGTWKGKGEASLGKLKEGGLLQMERIGFGRVDRAGKKLVIAFAHR